MNPFADDVFSGELSAEPNLPELYQSQLDLLKEALEAINARNRQLKCPVGRTTLLESPKAGAGKSHLLARLQAEHPGVAHFLDLKALSPHHLSWNHWLSQLLHSLQAQPSFTGNQSTLTEQAARLLGSGTARLIRTSRHTCNSPNEKATWLTNHASQLFESFGIANPTLSWFHEHVETLIPKIARDNALRFELDQKTVSDLLTFLYHYAHVRLTESNAEERNRKQGESLLDSPFLVHDDEAESCSRLSATGQLISLDKPLVVLLDDLDWIYRDENAALQLARMVSEFAKRVPNSMTVLSLNRDVWVESFQSGLPEALRDRLTASTCELQGVPHPTWAKFLEVRSGKQDLEALDQFDTIIDSLTKSHGTESFLMPRQLMRSATSQWIAAQTCIKEGAPITPAATERDKREAELTTPPPSIPVVADAPTNTTSPAPIEEEIPAAEATKSAPLDERQPGSQTDDTVEVGDKVVPGPGLAEAMGDLRNLIQARTEHEDTTSQPSQNDDSRAATPASSSKSEEASENTPILTPEFQSFMTELRGAASSSPGTLASLTSDREDALTKSDASSENNHHDSTSVSSTPSSPAQPLTPDQIATRLRELKVALTGTTTSLDLGALRQLLAKAGHFFPAIVQEEVTDTESGMELRWRFQQSEINFAFQPYSDIDHWRQLIAANAKRARELRERSRTRVKLALFCRRAGEPVFSDWNTNEEDAGHLQFCDAIQLTDHQLTAIYAVAQLLKEISETDHQAVFTQASGELDFFWKMITRPVWTLVSQISRRAV